MIVSHPYVFFGEMSVSFFGPLFDWVICFSGFDLYILEINPLSVVPFAIIFSHSEGCLCIFLMVSFDVQKLLCLIKSCLFFVFIFVTLGGGFRKILL